MAVDRETGYAVDTSGSSVKSWSEFNPDWDDEENLDLVFPNSVRAYKRMRREETQLQSVLSAVKLPITRTSWHLDTDGVRDEVAEFVSQNLGLPITGQKMPPRPRRRGRFSWAEHLDLALTEIDFGFSYFEQVYEYREGRMWLRKLGWRPQATILGVDVDADGGLVAVRQNATFGRRDVKIPVDRIVAYVNQREGANWFGVSLMRPSYKYWMLKDRQLRVQAMTGERNGLGVPVYTSPSFDQIGLSAEEIQQFTREDLKRGLEIARSMRAGEDAGAAIPNGAKLELVGVSGTLPDLDKPIQYYDEQMNKAALAHFLTLGTKTGSWALGTTLSDFFTMSLQTKALHIADVASHHIVEDLVDLNFGEDEPAPRITFDEIGSQSPPTAEALQSLVQTKVIRPDDNLESFMRRRYSLPEADQTTSRDIGNPSLTLTSPGQEPR